MPGGTTTSSSSAGNTAKTRSATGTCSPRASVAGGPSRAEPPLNRIVRGRPKPEQVARILMLLDEHYGASAGSLEHRSPYELLVATILSAQCTDARVNMVTPALFEACPTPADLDAIPASKLERLIKSTGFFRNKTKSLKG